jgi:hypothetical protein
LCGGFTEKSSYILSSKETGIHPSISRASTSVIPVSKCGSKENGKKQE